MSSVSLSKFDYMLSLDSEIKEQINEQQNTISMTSQPVSNSAEEGEETENLSKDNLPL